MLKNIVEKVKGDLDSEKKDREATEETMLTLLEDTCKKLNQAIVL